MMKKDKSRAHDSSDPIAPAAPAATGNQTGESAENDVALTAEEIDELKAQAAKSKEHWEQLLRTAADLDNYKKRAQRERQEAIQYANAGLLQKLIPVLDNLEMAMAATTNADAVSAQSLQTGVSMILSQLRSALTEAGLEEIDAANKPFDPNFHEAVSQQESRDLPEGHVLQQLRKGYKLRDRLLRPATVIVSKKPAPVTS